MSTIFQVGTFQCRRWICRHQRPLHICTAVAGLSGMMAFRQLSAVACIVLKLGEQVQRHVAEGIGPCFYKCASKRRHKGAGYGNQQTKGIGSLGRLLGCRTFFLGMRTSLPDYEVFGQTSKGLADEDNEWNRGS